MWVTPALDELEDSHACLGVVPETRTVDEFALECGEEAFGHGVIEAIADRTHGGAHTLLLAALAES